MPEQARKTCFVVAPIGAENSETRLRSDKVYRHIVRPATEECGYDATRADHMPNPGIITSQVIQRLLNDDLVIADLTGSNPNVYYELAVRHAARRPFILLIDSRQQMPFDIASLRTIQFDYTDLDSAANCRTEIAKQIRSLEADPTQVDSPISAAIDLQRLMQSDDPREKSNAVVLTALQNLSVSVEDLSRQVADIAHQRQPLIQWDPSLSPSGGAINWRVLPREANLGTSDRLATDSIYNFTGLTRQSRQRASAIRNTAKPEDTVDSRMESASNEGRRTPTRGRKSPIEPERSE
ncbi:MAG: hypothetical protein ACYC3S_11200 [Chloroflexota bacterium]